MGRAAALIKLNEYQQDALHEMEREFAEAGRHRWADRCRAVRLRADGYGIDEIAHMLRRPYRTAQDWCRLWRRVGLRGMTPKTSTRGRPKKLGVHERLLLSKAIDRGPVAAGYLGSVWTSPMLVHYIRKRWGVEYHPGHVRRLLHQLGFSIQSPREKLALADKDAQERWLVRTFPRIKKTPSDAERASSSRMRSTSNKKGRRDGAGLVAGKGSSSTTTRASAARSSSAQSA